MMLLCVLSCPERSVLQRSKFGPGTTGLDGACLDGTFTLKLGLGICDIGVADVVV